MVVADPIGEARLRQSSGQDRVQPVVREGDHVARLVVDERPGNIRPAADSKEHMRRPIIICARGPRQSAIRAL